MTEESAESGDQSHAVLGLNSANSTGVHNAAASLHAPSYGSEHRWADAVQLVGVGDRFSPNSMTCHAARRGRGASTRCSRTIPSACWSCPRVVDDTGGGVRAARLRPILGRHDLADRGLHERGPPRKIVPCSHDDRFRRSLPERRRPRPCRNPITDAICGIPRRTSVDLVEKIRPSGLRRETPHPASAGRRRPIDEVDAGQSFCRATCWARKVLLDRERIVRSPLTVDR